MNGVEEEKLNGKGFLKGNGYREKRDKEREEC